MKAHNLDSTSADGDALWLAWQCASVAAALDAHGHTQVKMNFPDFDFVSLCNINHDGSQRTQEIRKYLGLCVYLLQCLQSKITLEADTTPENAFKQIDMALVSLGVPQRLSYLDIQKATAFWIQGDSEVLCRVLYWLLVKIAETRRLTFAKPVYPEASSVEMQHVNDTMVKNPGGQSPVPHKQLERLKESKTEPTSSTSSRLGEEMLIRQAQESLRSMASLSTTGVADTDSAATHIQWRQHACVAREQQRMLHALLQRLATSLPLIAEKAQQELALIREHEVAVTDAFPEMVREYARVTANESCYKKQRMKLQTDLKNLQEAFGDKQKQVQQLAKELEARAAKPSPTAPEESLENTINAIQEEMKYMNVRAAILRHVTMHATPHGPASAEADGETHEEIAALE